MNKRASNSMTVELAPMRRSRILERALSPSRHLRGLPTRTRPNLFGGD